MGILVGKKRKFYEHRLRGLRFSGMARLAVVGMIAGLASAMINTIWAVYMGQFLSSIALIGLFSAFLTIISFFSYFLFIPLMEKMNKAQIFSVALAVMGAGYVALSITKSFYLFAAVSIAITLVSALRITSFGIILRDKSNPKKVSKNFGMIYSLIIISWIIGPLIAAYFLNQSDFRIVFSIGALCIFLSLLIFRLSRISDSNIKKRVDRDFFKNFKAFFSSKDRVKSYIMNGGSALWMALAYLFMPLYIIKEGLPLSFIGYFLFLYAIIPGIGEYYFGKLAGRIGYKKIFMIGFYLMAVLAVIAFFISNPYIVMGLIILSGIGIAMTESTTDSYFLDLTNDKEELRFYGPYNTAIEACEFAAKLLSAVFLIFLPFNYIFLVFGALMLIVGFVSSTIKDVVESRRRK